MNPRVLRKSCGWEQSIFVSTLKISYDHYHGGIEQRNIFIRDIDQNRPNTAWSGVTEHQLSKINKSNLKLTIVDIIYS